MTRRPHTGLPAAAEEHWTVDAIEETPQGRVARVELPGGRTTDLPLHALPDGVQEGDVLAVEEGPDGLRARRLPAETAGRRQQAQTKLDRLNTPAPEGEEITL